MQRAFSVYDFVRELHLSDEQVRLGAGSSLDRVITGLSTLIEAGPGDLTYYSGEAHHRAFLASKAGAILVHQRLADSPPPPGAVLLIVEDADLAFSAILRKLAPPVPQPPIGCDELCRIHPSAKIGTNVAVGPFVVIGANCVIGDNCVLHPGVVVGDDVAMGEGCHLYPNVVLRERITLGDRVTIHAGSVVGSDGFGYHWNGSEHEKVPQIGTVVIEDDVEIGSCACIDRAKFSETRIGAGSKIDNLVQVAHNCRVGRHCILAGQSGLAGSAKLGNGVILGGQSAVRDNVSVGDGVMSAARSGIIENIPARQVVSGLPALPHRQSLREQAAMRRLPDLVVQMRKLTDEVEQLKKALAAAEK